MSYWERFDEPEGWEYRDGPAWRRPFDYPEYRPQPHYQYLEDVQEMYSDIRRRNRSRQLMDAVRTHPRFAPFRARYPNAQFGFFPGSNAPGFRPTPNSRWRSLLQELVNMRLN